MPKSIQLQISKPCHENWNGMNETAKGRFCKSCSKEVIDFTLMNDAQIVHYMSSSRQNVCGRFSNEQINRNLIPTNEQKFFFIKYLIHVIIPALLLTNKTTAQIKITGNTVVCIAPRFTKDSAAFAGTAGSVSIDKNIEQTAITIKGKIIDMHLCPVPFASVVIKGTKKIVFANREGLFELHVSPNEKGMVLITSCIGFEPVETKADLKNINNGIVEISIPMMLQTTMGLVGEIVVVPVKKKKIPDTITNLINRTLSNQKVKVYPNPVYRGAEITIIFDIEDPGEFDLTMINSSGEVVLQKKVQVASKKQTAQMTCGDRLIPGFYILQIVEQSTQKSYTNKIIVL